MNNLLNLEEAKSFLKNSPEKFNYLSFQEDLTNLWNVKIK
jgi:hypothetical protein